MEYSFCPNCNRKTGHKRALGMGTLIGGALTFGASLAAIPFYPKRCIVCGRKTTPQDEPIPHTKNLRKCPMCAEYIKSEAKICRFCNAKLDVQPIEEEEETTTSTTKRVLCVDGNCIGVINSDGCCKICGTPHPEFNK